MSVTTWQTLPADEDSFIQLNSKCLRLQTHDFVTAVRYWYLVYFKPQVKLVSFSFRMCEQH